MSIPQEESEYWTQRAKARTEEMKQKQARPAPSLDEAHRANKPKLDEQRRQLEEQRRSDPHFFNGQGMSRPPLSREEKYRLINRIQEQ